MSQEVIFSYKTRGNSSPKDKPRVYFTCHSEDFERYFEKICEDIFKTHDCAIYYTEDMNADLSNENNRVDLERMNLFVIPVTFRLLTQPNRAMDSDFRFAMEKHIPVLPMMMEPGIDEFYSKPDKFGELQYINPYSHDLTEIGYEEKLKKYLESILISDELAQRVRKAFDAYIFLSYRKVDRANANELMKLIHKDPECRDIAVWFDEFLIPGESFTENIEKVLEKSELFTLLVTPNLPKARPDGTPNFIVTKEYPAAKKAGKEILPAEMEKTDRCQLTEAFDGIPDCVDTHEEEKFKQRFLDAIRKTAISENTEDPEHNYLIGLAYLNGIDVEINVERGIELITLAGEAGLPEAMEKLFVMYDNGDNVQLDYNKALYWVKKLTDRYKEKYGEYDPDTLTVLHGLAYTYSNLGDNKKALEINEKVYKLRCKVLGEEHPDTLMSLQNLSVMYGRLDNYQKAFEFSEKAYKLSCKLHGEEHPRTLLLLANLAGNYADLGKYKKSLELMEKAYKLQCKLLGEDHQDTLRTLGNIAVIYGRLGKLQKALELDEKVYKLRCKAIGEEHPDTLISLGNLASAYRDLEEYQKLLELNIGVYRLRCKVLGEEHPDTLNALRILAVSYNDCGKYRKALKLIKKAYKQQCKLIGEEYSDTLDSLSDLAVIYSDHDKYRKALEINEKVYKLRCKVLGEEHPDTLNSLINLASTYMRIEEFYKALEIYEKLFKLWPIAFGEDHPHIRRIERNIKMLRELVDN